MTAALVPAFAGNFNVRRPPTVNFFGDLGHLLDVHDPIGDDRGPGYYQYPLDRRIRRGTFDMTRFTVYDEGDVYTFAVQMRNYIMREWPDTRASEDQGFVAQMFDIYIDIDDYPGSGFNKALPGRDVVFEDDLGWEKMILVTPLSQSKAHEIIKHKTDDLGFQDMVPHIILPDYVNINRDRITIRIGKSQLGLLSPETGFQCFVLGYSHVVSPNRLLNRDVRGHATRDNFGGGWDTHGEPKAIDMIVPRGARQDKLLHNYRSEPYFDHIRYAEIPFVRPVEYHVPEVVTVAPPVVVPPRPVTPIPQVRKDHIRPDAPIRKPVPAPMPPPTVIVPDSGPGGAPSISYDAAPEKAPPENAQPDNSDSGFIPMRQPPILPAAPGRKKSRPRTTDQTTSSGFMPIRRVGGN